MDKRIEALTEWGCDTKRALERMVDDEEFYIECLEQYMQDTELLQLEESLSRQDIRMAFEHAHSLKGVLANLGLTPMYQLITEIVEPLRAGKAEDFSVQIEELKNMKHKLEQILKL
ncbi:MAG: Hpt domain-containing protein [Clostridia bacterium]|nr:Hpt domain-containing protein [Clostridia bacterium]